MAHATRFENYLAERGSAADWQHLIVAWIDGNIDKYEGHPIRHVEIRHVEELIFSHKDTFRRKLDARAPVIA